MCKVFIRAGTNHRSLWSSLFTEAVHITTTSPPIIPSNLVFFCKAVIISRRSFLDSSFAVSGLGTGTVRRVLDWAGAVGDKEQRIFLHTLCAFHKLEMIKSLDIFIIRYDYQFGNYFLNSLFPIKFSILNVLLCFVDNS